jgi:ATP-binding protein involved in chromosome partitioning
MSLPIEIVGRGQDEVRIVWDEGHEGTYAARDLRLRCRCAMCIHEFTGEKLLDPAKVPADIRVTEMELVGNYGLRIEFSDRHATGIYRFRDLLERCPCVSCRATRRDP